MGSGMEFFRRTLFLVVICALAAASNAQYEVSTDRKFKCSTEGATCLALVDYRPASGTYGGIQTLFNIRELRDIQGVNLQLKDTISPNDQVIPLGVIRIPFTRKCQDALGTSINGPFYKIQSDETLEHIGKVVFSNIVKWPQIQKANNISDPFNISMGQELRIPLPCSCDQVEGTMLVHYGRVFQNISTSYLEEMAQTAGIAVETMKDLNGILDESQIQAGEIYDVPLKGSRLWIWLTAVGGFIGVFILCYLCLVIWRKRRTKVDRIIKRTALIREIGGRTAASIVYDMAKGHGKYHKTDDGIQIFSFKTIATATNNFLVANKLGEGGFGPVYKGKLLDGQEIAIKRLSKSSKQGLVEFKNEAKLIANLQHTSLVKLLGFCVEREERILVYEYMANKSLDFYLFDSEKRKIVDWRKSFSITERIAQGFVYLHTYSRIIVIHRNLKASNVLLDNEMNPKISDFGMAKIFELKGKEENNKTIAGTRGYMASEYTKNGIVSLKTDVFSFGVLMLEIISGKRNHSCYHCNSPLNPIGLAWKLWNEGKGIEIMDQSLLESCIMDEVRRCIQVGLLCVQDCAADRPSMSEVVSMLSNENVLLPNPKPTAFYINEASDEPNGSAENQNACSINEATISVMDKR